MQKKNPMLPLYVADALMFLAVFLIALPNVILKEPLELGQTFALAGVVLIAMFMMLVPLVLNNRKQTDNELKSSQALQQIFADLRTLRDSLMEQINKINIAGGEIENLSSSLLTLENAFENFKNLPTENPKFEAELNSLKESISTLKIEIENLASHKAEVENQSTKQIEALEEKIEKLSATNEEKFKILDELCLQLQSIAEAEENEEETIEEPTQESEVSEEEAEGIEDELPIDEEEVIEEQMQDEDDEENFIEEVEETEKTLDVEDAQDFDENFGRDDDEEIVEPEELEEYKPEEEEEVEEVPAPKSETKGNPKWAGMLDKAFQNSQSLSTRETVSRFIEKTKQGDAPEESNGVEAPLEEPDIAKPASSMTIEELENTETFKEIDEGVKEYEDKIVQEDMLFSEDEIPQTQKPKRLKNGDTAVVVNAFLGIGNMPYVRGNGARLSLEKGVPMQLLEIGKYQWKCEDGISEPVKISIWLNDEIPSTLGELSLNPNETLDIDPSF